MERNYFQLACDLAMDAVENHIESRRGIWHLEREDVLCIYDNNPYSDDVQARGRQTDRIVRRLKAIGIDVIAHGFSQDEYTTTMMLDCSWDRVPEVQGIVSDEVEETLRELYSDL